MRLPMAPRESGSTQKGSKHANTQTHNQPDNSPTRHYLSSRLSVLLHCRIFIEKCYVHTLPHVMLWLFVFGLPFTARHNYSFLPPPQLPQFRSKFPCSLSFFSLSFAHRLLRSAFDLHPRTRTHPRTHTQSATLTQTCVHFPPPISNPVRSSLRFPSGVSPSPPCCFIVSFLPIEFRFSSMRFFH